MNLIELTGKFGGIAWSADGCQKVSIPHARWKAFAAALSCAPTGVSDAGNPASSAATPAASAQPVYWEWRHLDTANTPNEWSEWARVEPRNAYTDTVEDRVREYQGYIRAGYNYELRALYASPPPIPADVGMTDEEIRAAFKSVYGSAFMGMSDWHFARAINAAVRAKGANE